MIEDEDIKQIHTEIESKFPELTEPGIKSEGQLSFLSDVLSEHLPITFENVFEQSAYICISLIDSHPFVDGNKRTALCTAAVLLQINNYQLNYSLDWVDILPEIAREGNKDYKVFAKLMREASQPTDTPEQSIQQLIQNELKRGEQTYRQLGSV